MSNIERVYTKQEVTRVVGKSSSSDDQAMRVKTEVFRQAMRTELLG